jgi:DNA polymerase-1
MAETLYVIDVYSLLFQVFHAIPPMTGPKGQPTNAVFGFTRDIMAMQQQKRPEYFVCAMDSSGPGVRNEIYAEYKANRSEMPEDLVPQIPMLKEVLDAFRCLTIEHAGWEADDVLATVTREAVSRGIDVVIVTADKDARQLLSPHVRIFNARKNAFYGEAELLADWGVRPDQVVDFQSLVGDSVDNVPGVPLVGPKKAQALLTEFATLEGVLANADKAPGAKLKENLKNFADLARTSRKLVELNQHLPLGLDFEQARVQTPDHARLRQLFVDLGFRRLSEEMRLAEKSTDETTPTAVPEATGIEGAPPVAAKPKATRKKAAKKSAQGSLFDADGAEAVEGEEATKAPSTSFVGNGEPLPQGTDGKRTWDTIDTPEKFAAFIDELVNQRKICVDLETTGLDAVRADIVGWAIAWQRGHAYYIPVDGPPSQLKLDRATVAATLKPVLENPEVEVLNQNIKYDLLVLRRAGIHVATLGLDPMIGDYLLEAGERSHGQDNLALRYLDHKMIPISELIGTGKNQKPMASIDIARVAEYASEDADLAWQLADVIGERLREQNLWDLYWNLERELIPVLVDMEHLGIRVDVPELQQQGTALKARLAELMQEIHTEAGQEFNLDSPKQLSEILFNKLKLPVVKRTKTGPSTDQEVLSKLAVLHPLPAKITEHRHLSKLCGTYLDALPEMVNPETGRIHTSFSQVVAATGRLSSSDPNLQNIPIRTPEGENIRKAFIAGQPGWKLVCADYSQIELRMLAHFSGDPALVDAFRQGTDIHTAVAAQTFGVATDAVDSSQRRIAKAVNFGVIYGQSAFGLAETINIPQDEAAHFIAEYFTKYAGVDRFLNEILAECEQTRYARTILGRRREITGIRPLSQRSGQKNMPERTAINTVIQGSAADLIKKAMINIHARLPQLPYPARLLLQIHDELVFECPAENVADLVRTVKSEMEGAMALTVPLIVDVSAGDNWMETEPVS